MSFKEVIDQIQVVEGKPDFMATPLDTHDYREARCEDLFAKSGLDVLTHELEAYVKGLGYEVLPPYDTRYTGRPEGFFTLYWAEEQGSNIGKIMRVSPSLITEEIIFEGREELALGKVDWENRQNVENALAYTYLNPRGVHVPRYDRPLFRRRSWGNVSL